MGSADKRKRPNWDAVRMLSAFVAEWAGFLFLLSALSGPKHWFDPWLGFVIVTGVLFFGFGLLGFYSRWRMLEIPEIRFWSWMGGVFWNVKVRKVLLWVGGFYLLSRLVQHR